MRVPELSTLSLFIWSGGITACRRIAALAMAAGLPCVPHVFSTAVSLAANLHFIASIPNSYLLEFDQNPNALRTELLKQPVTLDDYGIVAVPEGSGFGVRLDRETPRCYAAAEARITESGMHNEGTNYPGLCVVSVGDSFGYRTVTARTINESY